MKKKILLPVAILFMAFGCTGIPKVADIFEKPTSREVFSREIPDEIISKKFDGNYEIALSDSLQIQLPYGEKGRFQSGTEASSYTFGLQEGEAVEAVVKSESARTVFMELLVFDGEKFETLADSKSGTLAAAGEFTGIFKLIIQPEPTMQPTPFYLSIQKKPMFLFPVAGKGNSAIQSYWGQERDGGARSHEGIDIFAPKGTPVVAVADGTISDTGERGIGGKQVWLRTGSWMGKSVYYAHLDRIKAEPGQTVKRGDTLGFVGNTGNAKGGAHHLHFGVYLGGARNPLPFVYQHKHIAEKSYSRTFKTNFVSAKNQVNLRKGPGKTFDISGSISKNEKLTLIGENNEWLHVRTSFGKTAFVHRSLVSPIS